MVYVPDLSDHTLACRPIPSARVSVDCSALGGFVCDVDGLLANSEPAILRCIFTSLEELLPEDSRAALPLHAERIKRECFGVNDEEMSRRLLAYVNANGLGGASLGTMTESEFVPMFRELRGDRFQELCRLGAIEAMPGAVEFLERAFERFGALAINTGSPEVISSAILQSALGSRIDLDRVFPEKLRTYGDEVGASFGKPDPAGYLLASRKLGIPPWSLAAAVDRGNDAISALRAGYALVVIVPEDHDVAPLFTYGKHDAVGYLSSLPDENELKNSSRMMTVGSLAWLEISKQ